jgi:Uma2 family endonuclease
MSAAEKTHTLAEYMALEAETGLKYEYYDGFLVAMAGGTPVHAQIGMNIGAALFGAFKEKDCVAYSSDARVAIETANSYLYPDVTVVCGSLEMTSGQAIANPSLVVEVMSETSELYDRGDKFRLYRQIPSLRQYVLVSQKVPRIEAYYRTPEGVWIFSEAEGIEGQLHLPAIETNILLADVYWKVAFETV